MSSLSSSLIAFHTLLSIGALLLGFAAIADVIRSKQGSFPIVSFLWLAIATSVTGYILPLNGVTPAVVTGVVALAVLAAVLVASRKTHQSAFWRWVYAGGIVASQYLLVFVAIAQGFNKLQALHALAPTQAEPPFAISQGIVLLLFLALGLFTCLRFHPERTAAGVATAR